MRNANNLHTNMIPSSSEESIVRENAQKSAEEISTALPTDEYHTKYALMITRLAKKEWFTARISACVLISSSFEKFTSAEQEIQAGHFASLCRDDAPMVRRVAAQKLGTMVLAIADVKGLQGIGPDGLLTNTFIPLYEELASSEQPDSVRLHTTENCIAFGKGITSIQQKRGIQKDALSMEAANVLVKKIVPLVAATIEDRSWRVRWTAASKFAIVIDAFKELDDTMDILIPAYEKLLEDPEAEVKTAAVLNLAEVAKCDCRVPPAPSRTKDSEDTSGPRVSAAKRLVKKVKILTEDDSENVRAALAMVATDLAPLLGKEATIEDLIPQVLLLLRDMTSEVRLNVISSLESLNQVIGIDLLSQSLLPAILDLAGDPKWR
jgi:serine/threonine-protein phosphatase 2A regulatory subunit A